MSLESLKFLLSRHFFDGSYKSPLCFILYMLKNESADFSEEITASREPVLLFRQHTPCAATNSLVTKTRHLFGKTRSTTTLTATLGH